MPSLRFVRCYIPTFLRHFQLPVQTLVSPGYAQIFVFPSYAGILRSSDFLSLGLNICTTLKVSSHNESHRENFRNLKFTALPTWHLDWTSHPLGD